MPVRLLAPHLLHSISFSNQPVSCGNAEIDRDRRPRPPRESPARLPRRPATCGVRVHVLRCTTSRPTPGRHQIVRASTRPRADHARGRRRAPGGAGVRALQEAHDAVAYRAVFLPPVCRSRSGAHRIRPVTRHFGTCTLLIWVAWLIKNLATAGPPKMQSGGLRAHAPWSIRSGPAWAEVAAAGPPSPQVLTGLTELC